MRVLSIFCCFIILVFFSCEKDAGQNPNYIFFKYPIFESDLSDPIHEHQIEEYWVYLNNEITGVHSINKAIPFLGNSEGSFTVFPGVRTDGLRDNAYIYPFLVPYTFSHELCACGKVDTIQPFFKYAPSVIFSFKTNFESGNIFTVDLDGDAATKIEIQNDTAFFSPFAGLMKVDSLHPINSVTNNQYFTDITSDGRHIFLELNYKSNIQFLIGIQADHITRTELIPIFSGFPNKDWKKLYLNLTETVAESKALGGYKIVFQATFPSNGIKEGRVYLDNAKLLHY